MPLTPELEKLLSFAPEAEREGFKTKLTQLNENGLRQEEFSRRMNEQSSVHKRNLDWYNQAKGEYDNAINELRQANEKLAALETARGSSPHPDSSHTSVDTDFGDPELAKALKLARDEAEAAKTEVAKLSGRLGEVDTMIKQGKLITAEKFDEEVNRRGDALGEAVLDIWELQQQHQRDYGVPMDRKILLETAAKEYGGNLKKAYEAVTKDKELERLRATIAAEEQKKAEDKFRNSSVPYAPGGDTTLGPLQRMVMQQKDKSGIPDDVPADGSGRLASLIAQELKSEGKY